MKSTRDWLWAIAVAVLLGLVALVVSCKAASPSPTTRPKYAPQAMLAIVPMAIRRSTEQPIVVRPPPLMTNYTLQFDYVSCASGGCGTGLVFSAWGISNRFFPAQFRSNFSLPWEAAYCEGTNASFVVSNFPANGVTFAYQLLSPGGVLSTGLISSFPPPKTNRLIRFRAEGQGHIWHAPSITGPWTDTGSTNPISLTNPPGAGFYRGAVVSTNFVF